MKIFFGHSDLLEFFNNTFPKVMCPQSWIFYGQKGLGKFTLIDNYIKLRNKENYLKENNYYKFNSDEQPSSLDDISKIINQLSLTNNSKLNDKTYVIIDNADQLNFYSHNALLKTIEEPPQNTLIILITHDLKKLPKTIISRCINIKFNKLKKKEFDDFLKYYFPKRSNNLEQLYKLTRGAPGLLNEYLLNNGDELFNLTKQLLELEKLDINIFNQLNDLAISNYPNNVNLVVNIIIEFLKDKIFEDFKNNKNLFNLLIFFRKINDFFSDNLIIDKKKELHYVFTEYFNLKISV